MGKSRKVPLSCGRGCGCCSTARMREKCAEQMRRDEVRHVTREWNPPVLKITRPAGGRRARYRRCSPCQPLREALHEGATWWRACDACPRRENTAPLAKGGGACTLFGIDPRGRHSSPRSCDQPCRLLVAVHRRSLAFCSRAITIPLLYRSIYVQDAWIPWEFSLGSFGEGGGESGERLDGTDGCRSRALIGATLGWRIRRCASE